LKAKRAAPCALGRHDKDASPSYDPNLVNRQNLTFRKFFQTSSHQVPRLRPGRPLRDRRADAQSHIRGYRAARGPHLGSSGAAAGGSLGIVRAGEPVHIGNARPRRSVSGSRPPGPQAGYLMRAAARQIVLPPGRRPRRDAPRLLIAHCSLLIAHCSLLIARRSSLVARRSCGLLRGGGGSCGLRVLADVEQRPRHLGGGGGIGLAGHQAPGDQRAAALHEPGRAAPGVLADG